MVVLTPESKEALTYPDVFMDRYNAVIDWIFFLSFFVSLLQSDHGVTINQDDTSRGEHNEMLCRRLNQELSSGFHLDLSLAVEVLTVMPSTRKIRSIMTVITITGKSS